MTNRDDTVQQRIRSFILQRFPGVKRLSWNAKTSLLQSGIVDSQGVLELVNFLEQEFSLTLSDDDLVPENFHSLEAVTQFVESRLAHVEVRAK